MEEILSAGFYPYLHLDNPEILIKDSLVYGKPRSLKKKVKNTSNQIKEMLACGLSREEIIDQSVELITSELRPSRFGYVCAVIASEFPKTFLKWVKIDALADQVLDVLSACEPVFNLLKFNTHTAEQHSVYLTLTNFIGHYLKRKDSESRSVAAAAARHKKAAIADYAVSIKPQQAVKPVLTLQSIPAAQLPKAAQTLSAEKKIPTPATATYFNSELLEKPCNICAGRADYVSKLPPDAIKEPLAQSLIMASKQYPINKGINKSIVFKGLRAQYIGYMGLGLMLDLLFYAVLYVLKVNTYLTLALSAALGAMITAVVYHLNARYGEHGLSKSLAKRKIPKIIRSYSRRIFW